MGNSGIFGLLETERNEGNERPNLRQISFPQAGATDLDTDGGLQEVVLASPTLWNNVASARSLGYRVVRGRNLSTGVAIDCPLAPDACGAHRIAACLQETGLVMDLILGMPDFEFPLLRSLALDPDKRLGENGIEMHSHLSLESLERSIPRLCRLSLSYIDTSWESLPPLQCLDLTGDEHIITPLPFRILHGILPSSPALDTLKLDMMLAEGESETWPAVELPYLELLYIRDLLPQCEDLLTTLSFLPSTRLQLCTQGIYNGNRIRDIRTQTACPGRTHQHHRAPSAPPPHGWAPISASPVSSTKPRRRATTAAVPFSSTPTPRSDGTNHLPRRDHATTTHLTFPTWKAVLVLLPALHRVRFMVDEDGRHFCEAVLEMGYPHLCAINVDTTVHTVQGAQLVPFFLDVLTRLLKSYFVANGEILKHFIVNDHFGALESEDEIWAELCKLVGKLDLDIRGWEYAPLVHNPQYHTLIVGD
ncbi:hypothetical protein K438DRAFT_2061919 [Mycena galopus ATCC 62051]|nr:hypothetical protein K438DRAFT_2061919 [Mycena galopus ATCC 62051]